MKKFLGFVLAAAVVLGNTPFAWADSGDEMLSMLESMKKQMTQMQQTIDQQNLRIQQLESRKVLESPQASASMQPSSASPASAMTENDWQKGIKDNIGDAIPWMKGTKFAGDLRLRMENFSYYDKNNDAGSTGTAADRARNRFRVRLRWGFEKDFADDWKVGFRLATGTPSTTSGVATDNTSPNVTLGNPGYFTFKNVYIDRAFAIYEPNGLKDYGALKGVKMGAGKFENPFYRYSTPIVWDGDVTPEGIYEQANFSLYNSEENKLNAQATLGQFIVNENTGISADASLLGYQGALTFSTLNFGTDKPVDFTGAVSFYDYTNWSQTILAAGNTTATSYLRTNSIVADDFRVLDLYPEIVFYTHKMPVTLWYNYIENLANVGTTDVVRSNGDNIHDMDTAWGLGFKIGKAKAKGSWELAYGYYSIGANAAVAAFSDSDFGGPGGQGYTNRQGHKFGLGYQLTENMTINWTAYIVRPLNPFNGNATLGIQNSTNESVFRSQLDAVYKF